MEADHTKKGFSQLAKSYKGKADDIQVHVDKMKEILYASQKSV
jgi:two-component system chemotaxis response regulator CheB